MPDDLKKVLDPWSNPSKTHTHTHTFKNISYSGPTTGVGCGGLIRLKPRRKIFFSRFNFPAGSNGLRSSSVPRPIKYSLFFIINVEKKNSNFFFIFPGLYHLINKFFSPLNTILLYSFNLSYITKSIKCNENLNLFFKNL